MRHPARALHCHPGAMKLSRFLPCAAAFVLATVHSAIARADESVSATQPEATHWYGRETMIVDGIALGAAATGYVAIVLADDSTFGGGTRTQVQEGIETAGAVLTVAGLGLYLVGPPLVHGAHHRDGIGLLDVLLRVAVPVLPALFVWAAASPVIAKACGFGDTQCEYVGVATLGLIGAAVGMVSAAALDANWLAREPASPESHGTSASASGVRWAPLLGATPGGAHLGVGGSF